MELWLNELVTKKKHNNYGSKEQLAFFCLPVIAQAIRGPQRGKLGTDLTFGPFFAQSG